MVTRGLLGNNSLDADDDPGGRSLSSRRLSLSVTTANLVSGGVVVLAVCIYLAYAVASGLPLGSALLGCLVIALTQVLPGALVWRCFRPRDGWLLEDLAAGFAIGSGLAVPIQIAAGLTHQRWLALAVPIVISAVLMSVPLTRSRIVDARWGPVAWWLAPVLGLLSTLALPQFIAYTQNNRITYSAPAVPHPDTYFQQALASELLTRGPLSFPTVAGEPLGYHWFTHAWIAQVSSASGVELDEVVLRLMPALMPMAVVLAVAAAGLRLGRRSSVALVAAAITIVGSRFNFFGVPDQALPLTPLSPTLGLGAPTLMLLITVLALRWRDEALPGAVVLVPFLAVVASATKGSTAPLVVAGLALACVAMLVWNRRLFVRTAVDLATTSAALAFAVVFVFLRSTGGLTLGVSGASQQTLLAALLHGVPSRPLVALAFGATVAAGLSRAALAFALPFFKDTRADPLTWLLLGGAIAGALAPAIFSHPGRSQVYFYLTAVPVAALGSALGFDRLRSEVGRLGVGRTLLLGAVALVGGVLLHVLPRFVIGALGPRRFAHAWQMTWIAVAIAVVVLVVGAVLARRGRRLAAAGTALALSVLVSGTAAFVHSLNAVRPAARTVALAFPGAVSQGQIDVARYIRDHSGTGDLVMTNRHCTVPRPAPGRCDSRRWTVTAFSERQSLVEGWAYTPRAADIAPVGRTSLTVDYWRPEILRLNDDFYTAPTAAAQQRLWDLGVRWVYVENTIEHAASLAPYATLRFQNQDASAWQLNAPSTG